MPSLENVAAALRQYTGRYEFLDAFADDVDELRSGAIAQTPMAKGDRQKVLIDTNAGRLIMQLFPTQGIARFHLAEQAAPKYSSEPVFAGAALGSLLGTAVSAASSKKEGLLGGLIVGMLVGGIVGAATAEPIERVLALRFDPMQGDWQVYDGPLLRWAKRTLHPSTSPAA